MVMDHHIFIPKKNWGRSITIHNLHAQVLLDPPPHLPGLRSKGLRKACVFLRCHVGVKVKLIHDGGGDDDDDGGDGDGDGDGDDDDDEL